MPNAGIVIAEPEGSHPKWGLEIQDGMRGGDGVEMFSAGSEAGTGQHHHCFAAAT